jgi:uncharacterized membrane protein
VSEKLKKARQRVARRRRDVNIKYGQAEFKQSTLGLKSCMLAFLSLLMVFWTVWLAFRSDGTSIGIAGGIGILAIVFTIVGIRFGVRGLKEKDRRKWSCRVGIVSCSFILSVLLLIFLGGM